jgi:hypothetical protein
MRRLAIGLVVVASLVAVSLATAGSPTTKERLTSAVTSSRAELRLLAVSARKLELDVSVRDPAAYLKHRYVRVVEAIYPRLAGLRSISLHVFDARSGRAVLSFGDVVAVGANPGRSETWHIARRYVDCARNLPLDDIEIDPERVAPRCPAA